MKDAFGALFGTRLNAALTLVMLALLWLTVPPFLNWALAHATWDGLSRRTCSPTGPAGPSSGLASACSSMAATRSPNIGASMWPWCCWWWWLRERCSRRAAAAGGCSRC